jgi:outer membrane lipoprotein
MRDEYARLKKEDEKMTVPRFMAFLFLALLFLAPHGCAYPISKQLRGEARKDLAFSMVLSDPDAYTGSTVIWGGVILETSNYPHRSEMTVLETPLDDLEEPKAVEFSQGRFIARTQKFIDPEIYGRGREITVAGEIIGKETRPLGKSDYTYPVIMVKELHLWPREGWSWYPPPYYGYPGPYPPGWGGWYWYRHGPYRP